ncbi:MAG: MbcA/ParS/Xre antitoxin family protein [Devosia sp.]
MSQAAFVPAGEAGMLDAGRFAAPNRKRLSGPALRTFLSIAEAWGLNEEQRRLVLGYPSRSTYHNWAKLAREGQPFTLDVDALLRISAVFGIHQALGVLFADEVEALGWLKGPHQAPVFGGQAPLALMISGTQDGLMSVRRFLDAARGGLYMAPNAVDAAFTPYEDNDIVMR